MRHKVDAIGQYNMPSAARDISFKFFFFSFFSYILYVYVPPPWFNKPNFLLLSFFAAPVSGRFDRGEEKGLFIWKVEEPEYIEYIDEIDWIGGWGRTVIGWLPMETGGKDECMEDAGIGW